MKATKIDVFGLFGTFDHPIPLSTTDRITIIHAPNGYGKTAVLRLVNAFSRLQYSVLEETEYQRLSVSFDDGRSVEVCRTVAQTSGTARPGDEPTVHLKFKQYYHGTLKNEWDRPDISPSEALTPIQVGRFVPNLDRVGPRIWRSYETGRTYGLDEILEEFADQLPEKIRDLQRPRWLADIGQNFSVHLVETQRLLTLEAETGVRSHSARAEPQLVPVVRTYAEHLRTLIRTALTDYAVFSQSLDRTFPNRVLQNLKLPAMREAEILAKLNQLEQARERLRQSGFLEEEGALVEPGRLGTTARRVLAVYVDDVQKKLARFDDLLSRVEIFTRVLSSHFQFKSIAISKDEGFVFRDKDGKPLALELLSSGEQHELVMTYELLFRTRTGSLILIDEPEISLHIEWQLTFLKDLAQMLEKTKSIAVISTHSPQIVNDRPDLMVRLKAPERSDEHQSI